jgi:hypothetical protein
MSDAVFVTNEGFAELREDMQSNDLSATDYFKLIVMKRDGDSMIAVRHTIQCLDAWIEGRTTALMREWRRHRDRFTELQFALVEWR